MSQSSTQSDSCDADLHPEQYKLPPVASFDDVNRNFDTLSGHVAIVVSEMKEHARISDNNLIRLAQETQDNLGKLADDVKAILSSQSMMLTIGVISVGMVIIILRSVFELGSSLVQYLLS